MNLRPAFLLGFFLVLASCGCADRTGEAEESIVLPPYLESVVFDVFSEDSTASVQVFAPGDRHHSLSAGEAGVDEIRLSTVLKALVVRRPAPGRWLFRKSRPGARVKILAQQYLPRGVLLRPESGRPVQQYERVFIAYQVTDERGFPLRQLAGYPLTAQLVLVRPDGFRLPLELHTAMGPGVFRTAGSIACHLPGRYWTEVVLTTRDLAGHRVRVFEDRWSGFSVRPVPSRR